MGRLIACLALFVLGVPAAAQDIAAACYFGPTTRYGHGVLGPGAEWGALRLEMTDGAQRDFVLSTSTPR